jgi:hypothetical protein
LLLIAEASIPEETARQFTRLQKKGRGPFRLVCPILFDLRQVSGSSSGAIRWARESFNLRKFSNDVARETREVGAFEQMIDAKDNVLAFVGNAAATLRVSPTLEALESEYGDRVCFARYEVSEVEWIPIKYDIKVLPCMLFFKGGELAGKLEEKLDPGEIQQKFAEVYLT